jgi:hypothetical protein
MDRYAFLASQPWLHELGGATLSLQPQQDAGQDTSGAVDAAEERLIAALGYQFKVEKLFSGVCCLHLLPLPQGVVVTPNSHCLFFDEGDRALDPAQLNLQFWVITHLLHRQTSLCAVFDGRPLQIDHTQCELLQTFGRGEMNGRATPAFIRMSFGAVALQLWYPPAASERNDTSFDVRGVATSAAAAADAAEGQDLSAATPATAGSGSEGDDAHRLEEVGQRLTDAVANKPFAAHKLPLPDTSSVAAGAATRGVHGADASVADVMHARLAADESRRTELLQSLQSLAEVEAEVERVEGGAGPSMADEIEPQHQQHQYQRQQQQQALLGVSNALAQLCDARMAPTDVSAALRELSDREATRRQRLQQGQPHETCGTPQWLAAEGGEEEDHADAQLWRKEEETKLLLQMSQGTT